MLDLGLKERFGTCTLPHGRVPHGGHVTVTASLISPIKQLNALPRDNGPRSTLQVVEFVLFLFDTINVAS